ncbi:CPBP family intramembrane metalloprotease [Lactiplantibacillus plantarum]
MILDKVFTTSPVINVVMMAVLAPIVEELIFRGLMYRWLFPRVTNWVSFTVALVFASLVFALAHTLSFSPALLAYLPIAVVLTFTYVWFNDIRYSVTLHIINNSLAMVGMLTLLSR